MDKYLTGPLSRYSIGWLVLFCVACYGVYLIYLALGKERTRQFATFDLSVRAQFIAGLCCIALLIFYSFGILLIET